GRASARRTHAVPGRCGEAADAVRAGSVSVPARRGPRPERGKAGRRRRGRRHQCRVFDGVLDGSILRAGKVTTMTGIATLRTIVLDCPEPRELADFYTRLLGGRIVYSDDDWTTV